MMAFTLITFRLQIHVVWSSGSNPGISSLPAWRNHDDDQVMIPEDEE
jgi:hypothetical protein